MMRCRNYKNFAKKVPSKKTGAVENVGTGQGEQRHHQLTPQAALFRRVHGATHWALEHTGKRFAVLEHSVGAVLARAVRLFRVLLVAVRIEHFAPDLISVHCTCQIKL